MFCVHLMALIILTLFRGFEQNRTLTFSNHMEVIRSLITSLITSDRLQNTPDAYFSSVLRRLHSKYKIATNVKFFRC